MIEPIFLDTSFPVALPNRRDLDYLAANRLVPVFKNTPLVTNEPILFEIGNTLASGFRSEAAQIIKECLASAEIEVVRVTSGLFDRAFDLFQSRPDKEWGLVNCLSFVVMQERGITDALTHDQHFVQAGFRALLRGGN